MQKITRREALQTGGALIAGAAVLGLPTVVPASTAIFRSYAVGGGVDKNGPYVAGRYGFADTPVTEYSGGNLYIEQRFKRLRKGVYVAGALEVSLKWSRGSIGCVDTEGLFRTRMVAQMLELERIYGPALMSLANYIAAAPLAGQQVTKAEHLPIINEEFLDHSWVSFPQNFAGSISVRW